MKFDIHSYLRAGPIELGMTKDQVIALLGTNFRTRRGMETDERFPTIRYEDLPIRISFKSPGIVEAVEFFEEAELLWNGINLFELPLAELRELLLGEDKDLEFETEFIFISYELGIAVYGPDAEDDPNFPAEAIMIFERGYYDDL